MAPARTEGSEGIRGGLGRRKAISFGPEQPSLATLPCPGSSSCLHRTPGQVAYLPQRAPLMNRLFSPVTVLLSLLACPSDGSPTPQAAHKPGAEKQPTKDARLTIAFSKDGLTINGSRI